MTVLPENDLRVLLESAIMPASAIIGEDIYQDKLVISMLSESPQLMKEYAYLAKDMPQYYNQFLKDLSSRGTCSSIILAANLFPHDKSKFFKMYLNCKPKSTIDWMINFPKHNSRLMGYIIDNHIIDDEIYYYLKIKRDNIIKLAVYNQGYIDKLKEAMMQEYEFFDLQEFHNGLPEEYQLGIIL